MRLLFRILLLSGLFALLSANAATYYIDYSSGSDANNGIAKAAPWKRAPGMKGFAGSYSHTAGDSFIFKGGVTWPYTCFNMNIVVGGSGEATRDYYGVDTSWYTGASFSRPIFDQEHKYLSYGVGGGLAQTSAGSYITIDNIEFIRNAGIPGGGNYGSMSLALSGATYVTVTNCVFRDWAVIKEDGTLYTSADATGWDQNGIGGVGCFGGWTGIVVTHCTFHQSGVAQKSGCSLRNVPLVRYSEVYNTTQGTLGGGRSEYCHYHDFPNPTDAASHCNAIQSFTQSYHIGNRIHDLSNVTTPITIAADWGNPGATTHNYVINNVMWNVGWQTPIGFQTGGNPINTHAYVWNNTVSYSGYPVRTVPGTSFGPFDIRNNHFITSQSVGYNFSPPDGSPVSSLTYANNLVQTAAQATAAGYVVANEFQPTSGASPTVNIGADLSASFTKDVDENVRVAWDAGAYEFGGVGAVGTLALSAASYSTAEDTTLVVTVSRTGGSSGAVSVAYATADGTAVDATDYTAASGTAELGDGETSATFNVTILRNAAHTGNLTFTVTLSSPTGTTLVAPTSATVLIEDTDPTPSEVPTLDADFAVTEMLMFAPFTESGGFVSQSVETLSTNDAGKLVANFTIAVPGTYQMLLKGVNAVHTGSDSFNVQINGTNDVFDVIPLTAGVEDRTVNWRGSGTFDAPEFQPMEWTFDAGVHLLVIYGREAGTTVSNVTFTLQSSPPPPAQQIYLGGATAWIYQNAGSLTLTVYRSASTGEETVNYATADGTALAGTHYTATSGTITFAEGVTSATITVPITSVPTYIGTKSFSIELSEPSEGTVLAAPTATVVAILDDSNPDYRVLRANRLNISILIQAEP